jgi:hypothetical protein
MNEKQNELSWELQIASQKERYKIDMDRSNKQSQNKIHTMQRSLMP